MFSDTSGPRHGPRPVAPSLRHSATALTSDCLLTADDAPFLERDHGPRPPVLPRGEGGGVGASGGAELLERLLRRLRHRLAAGRDLHPGGLAARRPGEGVASGRTLDRSAAAALLLHGRAGYRAERTEHATVAAVGPQQRLAVAALVEEQAGVRGHRFLRSKATVRAGQHGIEYDGIHFRLSCAPSTDSRRWSWP